MREIINLTGEKKRKRILVIFVGIPITTSSERLNPRWLMEQGKHTASFSQLASKHAVLWVLFLNSSSPLSKDHKCSLCFLRWGEEKDTFSSEIWHSRSLAFSFSSSRGYLTFCERSWAGKGRIGVPSSGHREEQEVSCRDESPTSSCEFWDRDPPGAAFLILCREQVLTTAMLID